MAVSAQKSLEFLLFSGDYNGIIARTAHSADPAEMPPLIGALALSGRLDEAQSAFRSFASEAADAAAVTQARFFVVAGLCHAGQVSKALRLVRQSLADRALPTRRTRFWIWQGLALVRFFEGRFARSRAAARRALASAIEASFAYARVLALDLLAHVLLHTGQLHAGMRLLEQAAQLAESLGYADNTLTLRTSAVVYRLEFLLTGIDEAIAEVEHAVAEPAVSYFTRRNALIELAAAQALRGDGRAAQQRLDEARRIALPGSDRRGKARWLVAQGLLTALSRSPAAAREVFEEARVAAGEQVTLLAELAFVEAIFGAPAEALREQLPHIARTTGIARARLASAYMCGEALPAPTQIEDGLSRVLLRCWRAEPAARLELLLDAQLLGLVPWALELKPGRRLILTESQLISEDRGTLSARPAPGGPSLRLLQLLGQGFQPREELAREVWGLARYNPSKHSAVINTAISRLRASLADPAWIVTHESGYHLLDGVALLRLDQADASAARAATVPPPPRPEEEALLSLLRREGPLSSADAARALKLSPSTALRLLRQLVDDGRLERSGKGRSTRYQLADALTT